MYFKKKNPKLQQKINNNLIFDIKNIYRVKTPKIEIYNITNIIDTKRHTTTNEEHYNNEKIRYLKVVQFIHIHECLYPNIRQLLNPEADTGFTYFLAFNTSKEKQLDYHKKILHYMDSMIKKNKEYSGIKHWFRVFELLKQRGFLDGVIIPKQNEFQRVSPKEYMKSLENLSRNQTSLHFKPLNISFVFVATQKIIKKNPFIYIKAVMHEFENGAREVIIGAYKQRWINIAISTANHIEKELYNINEIKKTVIKIDSFKQKNKKINAIYISLKKSIV